MTHNNIQETFHNLLNKLQDALKAFYKNAQPTLDRLKEHKLYDTLELVTPLTLFIITVMLTRYPYVILGIRLVDSFIPYNLLTFICYTTGGGLILWQAQKLRQIQNLYSNEGKFLGVGLIWMMAYLSYHLTYLNAYNPSLLSSFVFGAILLYGFYHTQLFTFPKPQTHTLPPKGPQDPKDVTGDAQTLSQTKPSTPQKDLTQPLQIDESTIEPSKKEDIESFLPPKRKDNDEKPKKEFTRFTP